MSDPIAYDKAKWHYDGDFPADLPPRQGFVHTGLYLAWLAERGLISDWLLSEGANEVAATIERIESPIFLYERWDGCLIDDMLSDEGNAFSQAYFAFATGEFLKDYNETFSDCGPSPYHAPPTWESYDRLKPVLDRRLREWRASK